LTELHKFRLVFYLLGGYESAGNRPTPPRDYSAAGAVRFPWGRPA